MDCPFEKYLNIRAGSNFFCYFTHTTLILNFLISLERKRYFMLYDYVLFCLNIAINNKRIKVKYVLLYEIILR